MCFIHSFMCVCYAINIVFKRRPAVTALRGKAW